MKKGITEWKVNDENFDQHTFMFEKNENGRFIYLDGVQIDAIPNERRYSELFNFEYRFKALGKECRIVNMVGQKNLH